MVQYKTCLVVKMEGVGLGGGGAVGEHTHEATHLINKTMHTAPDKQSNVLLAFFMLVCLYM